MIGYASSKEEVLEKLAKDVYATSGVWDLEKVGRFPIFFAPLYVLTGPGIDPDHALQERHPGAAKVGRNVYRGHIIGIWKISCDTQSADYYEQNAAT